jgi:hypothetical protein
MPAHLIWQAGIVKLKNWGLLDKIRRLDCPPITRICMDLGEFHIAARLRRSPARRRLMLPAGPCSTRDSGAEVREGFLVSEILMDGAKVTGIRGRTEGGAPVAEPGRVVIGAYERERKLHPRGHFAYDPDR